MTPREKGIRRLNQDAGLELIKGILFGVAIAVFPIGLRLVAGPLPYDYVVEGSILLGFISGGAYILKGIRDRKVKLLQIKTLDETKPFSEAYKNGQILLSENSLQSETERRNIREKYHQLKDLVENQIRSHQQQKEVLQYQGKSKDAQGMAALILDLGDAEKQLQKELSLIERGYQPVQIPHVAADPSPVSRTKPTRETGLEDY